MKTLQRVVLVVAVLSLFLASRAEAAMLNLDFTITLKEPSPLSLRFEFFQAPLPPSGLPYGGATSGKGLWSGTALNIAPGTYQFSKTVDVTDLSKFWFSSWGSTTYGPGIPTLLAASPPGGYDPMYAWSIG